jgi:hypothetical protein
LIGDQLFPDLDFYGVDRGSLIFMQDGAPAHRANAVMAFLRNEFGDRILALGSGNYEWPPRSPDLTPCDFYLWGYIKWIVYQQPIIDLNDLKNKITAAVEQITVEVKFNNFN